MSQLDEKDQADAVAGTIQAIANEIRKNAMLLSREFLFKNSNKSMEIWHNSQISSLFAFRKKVDKLIAKGNKAIKIALKNDMADVLKGSSIENVASTTSQYINQLGSVVIESHQKSINRIFNPQSTKPISQEIINFFKTNRDVPYVRVNINGKNYRWESMIERKVRTEINQEIAYTMIDMARENDSPFFIASYFDTCANDHVEYQGKIYISNTYQSDIKDANVLAQVEEYVEANNIMTIQDVMGANGNYFTTRPNCRHTFQTIPIEDVLEIKTDDDLKKERDSRGLQFGNEYDDQNYKDMQEQRANERAIKRAKEEIEFAKTDYDSLPANAPADVKEEALQRIKQANHKLYGTTIKDKKTGKKQHIEGLFEKQRNLIASNNTLVRDYRRENPEDFYDLGIKR